MGPRAHDLGNWISREREDRIGEDGTSSTWLARSASVTTRNVGDKVSQTL